MKLSHFTKVVCVSTTLLLIAGCSTAKKPDASYVTNSDATTNNVKTAGLGQEENLAGSESALADNSKIGDQTYYFDYDQSTVHNDDKSSIELQARYLAAHSNAKVLLEGNTDPRGSREYNIGLGDRRANSVEQLLEMSGVNKDQIRTVSYGAEQLASAGHSEQDYQADRRVHLTYEAK